MILHRVEIDGPCVIEPERHVDERGFFARTYSTEWFLAAGLEPCVVECSVSFNPLRGTLRGMHLQGAPFEEAKLVRCTRGRIFDVAVDVRPQSPHFGRWASVELDCETGNALYLPAGFAHGFVTLEPRTEVFYQMAESYHASAATGVRWDDPELAIDWPVQPAVISERDRHLPSLAQLRDLLVSGSKAGRA